MDNNKVSRIAQVRHGNTWSDTFSDYNETDVYKSLSRDLIAKKINQCRYIKSIKRIQNYNGFITIIVAYDNNTRSVYTVKEF